MSIITFVDADGVEQTLDTSKPFNVAYHVDCRVMMKALPDKLFDLCCADPPYGDGTDSSQIGNVEREREREAPRSTTDLGIRGAGSSDTRKRQLRFHGGGKKDPWKKYLQPGETLCQPGGGTINTSNGTVARTGGTWAEKYGKKS